MSWNRLNILLYVSKYFSLFDYRSLQIHRFHCYPMIAFGVVEQYIPQEKSLASQLSVKR